MELFVQHQSGPKSVRSLAQAPFVDEHARKVEGREIGFVCSAFFPKLLKLFARRRSISLTEVSNAGPPMEERALCTLSVSGFIGRHGFRKLIESHQQDYELRLVNGALRVELNSPLLRSNCLSQMSRPYQGISQQPVPFHILLIEVREQPVLFGRLFIIALIIVISAKNQESFSLGHSIDSPAGKG